MYDLLVLSSCACPCAVIYEYCKYIVPASKCSSLWNLIPQGSASFKIAKLGFVFTAGFVGYKITIPPIRALISKYRKIRARQYRQAIVKRFVQSLILFLNQQPREQVEQFFDLMDEIGEMPEEFRYHYFEQGLQRIFGIEIRDRSCKRNRGF